MKYYYLVGSKFHPHVLTGNELLHHSMVYEFLYIPQFVTVTVPSQVSMIID